MAPGFVPDAECQAFFSADSTLLAIELRPSAPHPSAMYFALLNVPEKRWVRPQPIAVRVAPDSVGRSVGFVGNEHKLLSISESHYFAPVERATAFAVVIDPFEPKASTNAFSVSGRDLNVTNMTVDLANQRIWLADGREDGDCKLRATGLGKSAAGPKIPISDCESTDLILAAGGRSLLQFSRRGSGYAVTVNDTESGAVRRSELKPLRATESYWLDGTSALSPDGRWLALGVRSIHSPKGMGAVRLDHHIVVLDTSTLSVFSDTETRGTPQDFKVGEAHGQPVLAISGVDGWTRKPTAPATRTEAVGTQ